MAFEKENATPRMHGHRGKAAWRLSRKAAIRRPGRELAGVSRGNAMILDSQPPEQWENKSLLLMLGVCLCVCVCAQSCPTLCDSMDCSPPGSSVHGILQARILEGVAIPSSRRSSQPIGWNHRLLRRKKCRQKRVWEGGREERRKINTAKFSFIDHSNGPASPALSP